MRQLPQENLGCCELLYAFSPSSSGLGYEATQISYPRRERRAKKRTIVHGTPGFLGVVGACACNRYQALFSPPSGPGYEAKIGVAYIKFRGVLIFSLKSFPLYSIIMYACVIVCIFSQSQLQVYC